MQVQIVWWAACVLWSSTFLFIKTGLGDVPPLTFAWVRLVLALCVLFPIALWKRGFDGLAGGSVVTIAGAGALLLGVNYGLLYWGARQIPSGLVAILQSGTPLFALVMGWYAGSERVSLRKLVALVGGCAGVVLIFRAEASAAGHAGLAGAAMVLASSACVALAYVWLKSRRITAKPLTVTTIQCSAGVLLLAPAALVAEGSPFDAAWSTTSVLAVMYLAVGASVVAFGLNYWLLNRIDASAMLMMGIAEVPLAVALGAVILGERLPSGTFAGAVCVLAAVMLTSLRTPPVEPPPPPVPPTTRR